MIHAGEMMVMINDHFGGPSVHSAQILRKNPGTGQTPPVCLAMPGLWEHLVSQSLPIRLNLYD